MASGLGAAAACATHPELSDQILDQVLNDLIDGLKLLKAANDLLTPNLLNEEGDVSEGDDGDKAREKGDRLTDSDNASDQYEDIQKEQNRRRQQGDNVSIESIKKSKQRDKNALKPWKLDY